MSSVEQLIAKLDRRYSSRRRELTALDLSIQSADSDITARTLLRASVPIMYSHWEGFVKESAGLYVEHAYSQNKTGNELNSNLVALAVKGKMIAALKSRKTSEYEVVVKEIIRLLEKPVPVQVDAPIDTESNLSSKVLREVFRSIGLDFRGFWETQSTFIDRELVKLRNEIAHGEMRPVTRETYRALSDFIRTALELFKRSLEEAALNKVYLKVTTENIG